MDSTRRRFLGIAALTTGLAGCTGGGGTGTDGESGDGAATTQQPTAEPTTAPATGGDVSGPAIEVADHPELGEILVDSEGLTLYMFDSDEKGSGASTCSGGCAEAWPPLTEGGTPEAGDGVTADLTTFEREDGSTQVAAGGWPLYYFASDEAPGDVNGQGANDIWWVLRPDGTPVRPDAMAATVQVTTHPDLGEILVGPEGNTLYMFDSDTQGEPASTCYGGCAEAWPPLLVDGESTAGEGVAAELTTFERDDGSIQVAAAGWPLYYFASDEEPGDANGQAVNDVWWVLDGSGEPIRS